MKSSIIFCFAFITFLGCKPTVEESSSLNSLDNFSRSKNQSLTVNQCGIKMDQQKYKTLGTKDKKKLNRIITDNMNLKMVTASALAAVPKSMQAVFFSANGKIRLVNTPKNYCSYGGLSSAERVFISENQGQQMTFCWTLENNNLEIIMQADASVIQHGLVRIFSYVYTQFFNEAILALASKNSSATGMANSVRKLEFKKSSLGRAFMQDLRKGDEIGRASCRERV